MIFGPLLTGTIKIPPPPPAHCVTKHYLSPDSELAGVNSKAMQEYREARYVAAKANREKILAALRDGEFTVAELIVKTELSESCIASHLKELQKANVSKRRVRNFVYFKLNEGSA